MFWLLPLLGAAALKGVSDRAAVQSENERLARQDALNAQTVALQNQLNKESVGVDLAKLRADADANGFNPYSVFQTVGHMYGRAPQTAAGSTAPASVGGAFWSGFAGFLASGFADFGRAKMQQMFDVDTENRALQRQQLASVQRKSGGVPALSSPSLRAGFGSSRFPTVAHVQRFTSENHSAQDTNLSWWGGVARGGGALSFPSGDGNFGLDPNGPAGNVSDWPLIAAGTAVGGYLVGGGWSLASRHVAALPRYTLPPISPMRTFKRLSGGAWGRGGPTAKTDDPLVY